MDHSFSYELIRLYRQEMDRVVEKISLEQELTRYQQSSKVMLYLADVLIQLGTQIKLKFQPKESSCYIPHMIYREK
jgi:hypothetical protein